MAKSLLNKFRLALAVIMVFAFAMTAGMFGVSAKAEEAFTLDAITYEMAGSSLRIGEADGRNGLRFTARMSKGDYALLMSNVGEDKEFASVEFGVLIAPEYYTKYYSLNEETVFGGPGHKIYDWAEWVDNGWEYNGTNTLQSKGGTGIRIINIYTN